MTCATRITRAALALLCGALAACSSFDAEWKAAGQAAPGSGVTRWEGRWESAEHKLRSGAPDGGRLRAVLTETQGAPGSRTGQASPLRADFRANWKSVASSYTMALAPIAGSRTDFRGTHDLPAIFGGTYRYTARIRGDHFTARYDSSYDRGTFTLRRLPPGKEPSAPNPRH
jgi:hypothetical protein